MAFDKSKIISYVFANRLRDAFSMLKAYAEEISSSEIIDNLNTLEQTYRYMMHYTLEGVADENRASNYGELQDQLLRIADGLEILRDTPAHASPYYAEIRLRNLRPVDLESLLREYDTMYQASVFSQDMGGYDSSLSAKAEAALRDIFMYIWTTPFLRKSQVRMLTDCLMNAEVGKELQSQIISALLLGALFYYDSAKLRMLIDVYTDEERERNADIEARLLVAIMIICIVNGKRLQIDEITKAKLREAITSPMDLRRFRMVLLNIVRACDTDRINTKMRTEVIPEIMKMQPQILKRFSDMQKDLDMSNPEFNPEWEEILEKNGVADKLREFQDLQIEGSDVMMLAFSNLKGFPFFNHIANWFLPYSGGHSMLEKARKMNLPLFDIMLNAGVGICNSDKYSLALSLEHMPAMQLEAMTQGLNQQLEQYREELSSALDASEGGMQFETSATSYIRDIYRFFRLYTKRNHFPALFSEPVDFTVIPVLGSRMLEEDTLTLVSEFYFKHGYYKEARHLFMAMEKMGESSDEHLLQKIGYCYQMEHNPTSALMYYNKGELFNPDSKWLRRKLARLNRELGNYTEAAHYYKQLLETDAENKREIMSLAFCLAESGNYEEALKYYYKAHYIDDNSVNAWRGIAWCEMQAGRYEKSRAFYERILLAGGTAADYMNAGHLAILEHDYRKAISLYRESLRNMSGDIEMFIRNLKEDYKMLEEKGTDLHIMSMVIDTLQYEG